ncbi:MAG: SRPBCC family protein [Elusimicrobiota bacterium]|nr:MAG: SRPBCC family protein [Elusimicrobiota bacterium]
MKTLKIAGAVLAAAVAAVLVAASRQPDEFRIERKVVVAAAPEKVFPYLDDPLKTQEWSPWEKKDPNVKKTFSGAAKGKGAVYEWAGNKEIGVGRAEITESVPGKVVVLDLHFKEPMDGRSTVRYELTPVAGGTEVTWSMWGPNSFPAKVMCTFINMDKMVGGELEKGLAALKAIVEKK